jgi:putative ATPase
VSDQPLAARMRPRTPAEFVGQRHLVGPGRTLQKLLDRGTLPSLILWGPAGTGKTTLAFLLAEAVGAELTTLSAVSSGVADARKVMQGARGGLFKTVLFVDEVHRWSKAQQDVLLPAVEEGTITLIGATTENPYFSLNTPLLSRCLLLRLEPLEADDVAALIRRALDDEERGLGDLHLALADDALEHLITISGGDARMALTGLEAAALAAREDGVDTIMLDLVADAVQRRAVVYDRQGDAHYDVISAFIKSIRGSDPDAALFWLARMLEAGEDPRFIARRLIVHASEDVGLADPMALLQATAAAHAVEHVGLPEARLNLAQATIYLARAPKSNSVYTALGAALAEALGAEPVPAHLRDASYGAARRLGHGKGYVYPHDEPGHWVAQQHRPAEYEDHRYYVPSGMGEDTEEWRPGAGPGAADGSGRLGDPTEPKERRT